MVEITNVKVYELEESIVASGYAMKTEFRNFTVDVENLRYFTKDRLFLPLFDSHYKNQNKNVGEDTRSSCYKCGEGHIIQKFTKDGHFYCGKHTHTMHRYGEIVDDVVYEFINDYDVLVHVKGDKNSVKKTLISSIDVPLIFGKSLSIHRLGYLSVDGVLFHKLLLNSLGIDSQEVDHINRDPFNNTRRNLRPCSKNENLKNKTSWLGKEKFIGISFDKSRGLWKAYIGIDGKRKLLGRFKTEDSAKINRLKAECENYGEFSPNISLFHANGIAVPSISHLVDEEYSLKKAYSEFHRIAKLCKLPSNSGHNNALTGIRVAFDIKYPNYFSPELQRYHFIDIVTSSSKMHKLSGIVAKGSFNKYVLPETITMVQGLANKFNEDQSYENRITLLSNCPQGIELFMRCNTNYMQLRNLYHQRKNHRLTEDWGAFCDMIRELPYFEEFINK